MKMVLFKKIKKLREKLKLLGARCPVPLAIEDALAVEDKEVDLLVENLFEVDPKAAMINVKLTDVDEQAVRGHYFSDVKMPEEAKFRAAVDAAVLVGMAMGAALLLQEAEKKAKRRRPSPVPIQTLVSVSVPVPVLNSVPVFLPAPVERTALDVAVPAPLAAEAASVLPLVPALVPVLVPMSFLLEGLEEAAPASEPMFMPAPLLQAAPDEAASGPDPPPAPDEATDVPAAKAAPVPASRAGLAEFFNCLLGEATDVPAAPDEADLANR
jgi:hypothetical protein